jgi:hypothetical protein
MIILGLEVCGIGEWGELRGCGKLKAHFGVGELFLGRFLYCFPVVELKRDFYTDLNILKYH